MLPAEVRADVAVMEERMQLIDTAPNVLEACRRAAREGGGQRGWSVSRMRSKYYAWVAAGRTWTSLVDWAKVPRERNMPRQVVESMYKQYCENNQRSNKRAWAAMLRDIRGGVDVPGLGDWKALWKLCYPGEGAPSACPIGWVPPGMTYRNMQRYAAASRYELTSTRIGSKAAREFVPSVFSTRVGLAPGQLYQFDDVWHDIEIVLPGVNKSLSRPLEFACVDYASTNKIAYGLKPTIEGDDGKRKQLTEREMKWLVCHILTNVGYHKSGCCFVIEHGTATIRPFEREWITRMTGGLVTFRTSEIIGEAVHKGMFSGRGKGNFRAKALVESSHRLLHYESADLPAQTGGNSRVDRPEQLDGVTGYAEAVVAAWRLLPEDKRRLLWMPALSFWAYRDILSTIYARIYQRTDHACEGWDGNGWMVEEWSVDGRGDWKPVQSIGLLPEAMRPLAIAACKSPGHVRSRRMSPVEVWERGQAELIRLPPWAVIDLLGPELMHVCTVQDNGLIEFADADLEAGVKFRFVGTCLTPDGSVRRLRPGERVGVYALPYDSTKAVAVDADTRAVFGVLPAWQAVSPINAQQVSIMVGAQARMIAAADAPIIERHAVEARTREALIAGNDAIIAEMPASAGKLTKKSTHADKPDLLQVLPQTVRHTEDDPNEF
jgi:hypothetical protein